MLYQLSQPSAPRKDFFKTIIIREEERSGSSRGRKINQFSSSETKGQVFKTQLGGLMLTFLWHSTVSMGLVVLQPSLMMHTSVWASIREPRGQSMVLKGPGVP